MNRRDFLKFSALTGLAALIPINIVIDHRDDETKMIDYILTHIDDELVVLALIKEYGIISAQGRIVTFFEEFRKRQPKLGDWLRSRIEATKIDGKIVTSHERYNHHKSFPSQYQQWQYEQALLWREIGQKFNLPTRKVDKSWYLYDDSYPQKSS